MRTAPIHHHHSYLTSKSQHIGRLKSEHYYGDVAVPMAKRHFSEVDMLLQFYLTIPVTTCTAEMSFSSLHHIKTYLRSTMAEEHLFIVTSTERRNRCLQLN
jgi:hypothetical protein